MDASNREDGSKPVKQAIEIAINLGLIFIILAWGLMILKISLRFYKKMPVR
jgi:hypothetical protein